MKGPGNDRDLGAQWPLSISHDATWRRDVFLYTTNKQNTPLFKSPAWGTRKTKNISVRSVSSILLGLDREFKQIFRFFFVVLPTVLAFLWNRPSHQSDTSRSACLRLLGTAQVTSHGHCCSTASQLVESCVLSTRGATFVVYTLISRRESHHLVVSFTPTTPAPFGLGCPSLCVLLCRSVPRRTTRTRTPDNTGRSHDHLLVAEADRSLAPGAGIPRNDNQSFAVWICWWLANSGSRVRFPEYLPLRASRCSAASTG